MERKLVMTFKDQKENKFNLIVNSVKDGVTMEEINTIMDEVLTKGALQSKNGALTAKLYAVVVNTDETTYKVI